MSRISILGKHPFSTASRKPTLSELQNENAPWSWTDTHSTALEKIKELKKSLQILKPCDHFSKEPKYLVWDASNIGLVSWIGQGELESIRLCQFHYQKFSPTQLKYATCEKELLALVDSLKLFEAQLRDHKFTVLMDYQQPLSFVLLRKTSQKLSRRQVYMREFYLIIEHTSGKENLFADILSMKHKSSVDPSEEQDFIPQSIVPTEDNTEPQYTSITTKNLYISPIQEDFTLVSGGSIKFKHMDCDYNKCVAHDESLRYHSFCHNMDDENEGDYKDYADMKEEEMLSDGDTLSTIPKDIFDRYEFDPLML